MNRADGKMVPRLKKNTSNSLDTQVGAVERKVTIWQSKAIEHCNDIIAEEVAIAIVYNGISHAVMMASPLELEVFAIGFSLTEGIIEKPQDIFAIDIVTQAQGIEVALTISNRSFMQLKTRRRNLTGRTGCGICGAESLAHVRSELALINNQFSITHTTINMATSNLAVYQPLQASTGAVHGAAWCDEAGNIIRVCEDIGRHNALDKLIGSLWSNNTFQQKGFLLMSSRASYEIVQKAAKAGIAIVVAVSAPTSFAINIASEVGITLIGFSRKARHVVYSHPQRLIEEV